MKESTPRSRYRRQKHREKTLLSGWRPWCALHRGRFNCRWRFRGLLSCVFGMASSGAQNYRGAIIACACIHGVTNSQIVEGFPDVGSLARCTRHQSLFVQSEKRTGYCCAGRARLRHSKGANDVAWQRPILHTRRGGCLCHFKGRPFLKNSQYVPLQR